MTVEEKADKLRITNQFRQRSGFVYDLRGAGARLTIAIAPRETDEDEGEWRVEARTGQAPGSVVLIAWAATRVEALTEVGRSWTVKAREGGVPGFDWEAIAKALTEVRAL